MPSALFLSPHFDDVAFSCGGTFRALAARGWETTLCTIFTRSVANPTGFALACQLDKGLGAEVDYLALRRAEDDAAATALHATHVERLDLPEAPHRGYESAPALFGAFARVDDVAPAVGALVESRLGRFDVVFAPQALGNHVDHRRVRDAVLAVARTHELADRILWYRDTPYVLRERTAQPDAPIAADFPTTFAFAFDERALDAKLDACAAYATQLGFQFGGAATMREQLRAFALAESVRLNADGPCEAFATTATAMAALISSSVTGR